MNKKDSKKEMSSLSRENEVIVSIKKVTTLVSRSSEAIAYHCSLSRVLENTQGVSKETIGIKQVSLKNFTKSKTVWLNISEVADKPVQEMINCKWKVFGKLF